MKQLLRRRLIWLLIIGVAVLGAGAILFFQRRAYVRDLETKHSYWNSQIAELQPEIELGTFADQKVDDFIVNLHKQIAVLSYKYAIYKSIASHPELFPAQQVSNAESELQKIVPELKKYKTDRTYMAFAWIDYLMLRIDESLLRELVWGFKKIANFQFRITENHLSYSLLKEGPYVLKGQIVGLQGCSGICTGTHVHFVTYEDAKIVDPCKLLPRRPLTVWGISDKCGVAENKKKIDWPVYIPWIITQKYDTISPVLNNTHGALDIIDREHFPVIAAHSGWIKRETKPCPNAPICVDGAAKVVTICQHPTCKKGLTTEYWHLDWMVGEEIDKEEEL